VHVASGKCSLVVNLTGRGEVASNSRYIVIWEIIDQNSVDGKKIRGGKLKLFDLQSLRNASCPDIGPLSEHWASIQGFFFH
jgi:hypothetical protein